MINGNLLILFRDKVNSNAYFALHNYKNNNGKNEWNLICSCMDWLTVAVRYLMQSTINSKDMDAKSMQVYSFISAIDIVYQSILQLHKTIYNTKTTPFKGNKDIFGYSILLRDESIKGTDKDKVDDNSSFKHIRAMFGAHPVDLKDNNKKWFASWPYNDSTSDNDIDLSLYSENPDEDSITIGIKINDLIKFLETRYNYLNVLIEELDRQFEEFCNKLRNKEINHCENALDQLYILRDESKIRLDTDGYRENIDELIILFTAHNTIESNIQIVNEYRSQLTKVVREIEANLQDMRFANLETQYILRPDYNYSDIGYSVSKLFGYVHAGTNEHFYPVAVKEVKKYYSNYVIIHDNMTPNEILLLAKAAQFYLAKDTKTTPTPL